MGIEGIEVRRNGRILLDVVAVIIERTNLSGKIGYSLGTGGLFGKELFARDGIGRRIGEGAVLDVGDRRTGSASERYLGLIGISIVLDGTVGKTIEVVRDVGDGGFTVRLFLADGIGIGLDMGIEGIEVRRNGRILLDVVAVVIERTNLIGKIRIGLGTGRLFGLDSRVDRTARDDVGIAIGNGTCRSDRDLDGAVTGVYQRDVIAGREVQAVAGRVHGLDLGPVDGGIPARRDLGL